jgi:hypothetical protein
MGRVAWGRDQVQYTVLHVAAGRAAKCKTREGTTWHTGACVDNTATRNVTSKHIASRAPQPDAPLPPPTMYEPQDNYGEEVCPGDNDRHAAEREALEWEAEREARSMEMDVDVPAAVGDSEVKVEDPIEQTCLAEYARMRVLAEAVGDKTFVNLLRHIRATIGADHPSILDVLNIHDEYSMSVPATYVRKLNRAPTKMSSELSGRVCIGTSRFAMECLEFLEAYAKLGAERQLELGLKTLSLSGTAYTWYAPCSTDTNQMYVVPRDRTPRGPDKSSQDHPRSHTGPVPLVSFLYVV